ncbi:phage tail assembly protein [Azospirillum doebereinerae]|uniref:phage tail assembly protein n=1 Tax=Azospirillum doebereinerae TaxID=92933 RepID=UPI001EE51530|nr:phage tail assembly protein [Azospirillum doebereinerae]MCG5240105.1 phage tail assembly protein [Azospirillum doebereinerae]
MTETTDRGPRTIALSEPIVVGGRTLAEITLRRPKTGDLRRMDKVTGGDLTKTLWMIGTLAELSPAEVDEIPADDLPRIADVVAGFTGTARE